MIVPKPGIAKIKNDLDAIFGPGFCTNEMAKVVQKNNITIMTISEAADRILASAGVDFKRNRNPDIGLFFVQNPEKAVSLFERLAGVHTTTDPFWRTDPWIAYALSGDCSSPFPDRRVDPSIAKLFVQDPEKFVSAFEQLNRVMSYFKLGVRVVCYPSMAGFFVQNPMAAVSVLEQISKATKENEWAFQAMINPDIASLAMQNPTAAISVFSQISQVWGERSWEVFDAIADRTVGRLFLDNQAEVVAAPRGAFFAANFDVYFDAPAGRSG